MSRDLDRRLDRLGAADAAEAQRAREAAGITPAAIAAFRAAVDALGEDADEDALQATLAPLLQSIQVPASITAMSTAALKAKLAEMIGPFEP